ncbi:Multicopper oxidase [Gaiella occulta]|uniref:Copper-containing nitrite reductase n=1 Tax=Gaiella occulta TaxID=1002870 RepID=A0A7M2YX71_9ACTN|nr:multicopper oxidase domain-containing protein [Gaiella occulta]RDI74330.1 Multicopper oxidase [Gaiella occulta]
MKTLMLGLGALVAAVVILVAAVVASNRALDDDVSPAAAGSGHENTANASATTPKGQSFAGVAPENAKELALAHKPYPAELPPLTPGPVVKVRMVLKDVTIQIAPGVSYQAWGFEGGAPGPIVHARQGQTVEMTLTNDGAIPHSIDFHAARIAPNEAFVDVMPGKSFTFRFKADDPGVFMYHCGTKPVLAHIANGMYGAIVVDPATPLPKADKEYVLVAGEWYLGSDGLDTPAQLDMNKARAMMPDWTAFNGYAHQYVEHPLTADPGDLVRFYVVDAGPSLTTAFHVVGTVFDNVYPNGDMNPAHVLNGVQTVDVPAGGGGVFEVKIDEPGLYPFVSHAFAHVDLGQVGLLEVGKPKEAASQ